MKTCSRCSTEKSLSCFYKRGKSLSSWCKDCQRDWNRDNREVMRAANQRQRDKKNNSDVRTCSKCLQSDVDFTRGNKLCDLCLFKNLKKRHPYLTPADIEYILAAIKCDACSNTENLRVDHCHKLMRFRGVLCNGCNTALGMVRDNAATLISLANYINS